MKKHSLSLIVAAACLSPAYGQEALAPITVSGSREALTLQNSARPSTVITDEKIATRQAQTLGDALKTVPSVSVESSRGGEGDVTIRGVTGVNRVNISVDGLPIAESFEFGPWQNSGREYFETNNVQSIEIKPSANLKTPSSIGGEVKIKTSQPSDFIKEGQHFGGNVFVEYTGKNKGKKVGVAGAFKTEQGLSGLLEYAHTSHQESNNSDVREKTKKNSLNGKMIYQANENNTFTLNGALFHSENKGQDSLYKEPTKDIQERKALSLSHDFALDTTIADDGYWKVYAQEQQSKQNTFANITRDNKIIYKDMNNSYKVRDTGFELELNKNIATNLINHDLTYGFNFKHSKFSMQQFTNNFAEQTTEIIKHGPDTITNNFNLFVTDKMTIGESGLSFIPGLTYNYYALTPEIDDIYQKSYNKYLIKGKISPAKKYTSQRILPKLGVVYDINANNTLFANYNEGFRAPSFAETNFRFLNLTHGYGFIGNPNLTPESSRHFELGYKINHDNWTSTLTGFYNHYKNYISQTPEIVALNKKEFLTVYKYDNISSAAIYGLEWSANWQPVAGLNVQGTLAYNKGKNKETGKPLTNINPLGGVVSVNYDAPEKRWGAGATFTASMAKKAKDISARTRRGEDILPSAGYGVLDLTAYYRPVDDLTIRAGVYNVFNKKYMPWSTARSLSADKRTARNNEPERWVGASFRYEF